MKTKSWVWNIQLLLWHSRNTTNSSSSSVWSCPWWNTPQFLSGWRVESYESQHENRLVCTVHMSSAISSTQHSCRVTVLEVGKHLWRLFSASHCSKQCQPEQMQAAWSHFEYFQRYLTTCSTAWAPLETKCFLLFKWIFLYFSLCLLLLVQPLNTTEKSFLWKEKRKKVSLSFKQVLKPPAILVTLHWTCSSLPTPDLLSGGYKTWYGVPDVYKTATKNIYQY